jgi:hypothetical protein
MTITSSALTKAAGAAAVAAGAIFIGVQIGHPPSDSFTTETAQWVARSSAKAVMAVLALVGITGMYLHQHRKAGVLGLVGYVVFAVGYLFLFATEVVAAAVLPSLVTTEPGYVNDVVTSAVGGTPSGDIGAMQVVLNLGGAGYILGGLIFGIALFRTGVLARWASALLAVATLSTAALAVLPESFNRPLAVPEAIALIGLGVSLWRSTRAGSTASDAEADTFVDAASPARSAAARLEATPGDSARVAAASDNDSAAAHEPAIR